MRFANFVSRCAQKLGIVKKAGKVAGAAILAGSMMFAGAAKADTVAFDDFEGLTLEDWTFWSVASGGLYTRDIRTTTDPSREWVVTTFGDMTLQSSSTPVYVGGAVYQTEVWDQQQGDQGRFSQGTIEQSTTNECLGWDPDGFYDFDDDTQNNDGTGFNSYATRTYDLTGESGDITIEFDYEYRQEDTQRGQGQYSQDGGATWTNMFDHFLDTNGGDTAGGAYQSGQDVQVTFAKTSDTLMVRFGVIEAGNDWWMAVDNVEVSVTSGYNDLEDFEGLESQLLDVDGNPPAAPDTTVWTNNIPNWTIDNSQMPAYTPADEYNGWTAMDADAWSDQAGQGRTNFQFIANNTVLVADNDQFEDEAFEITDLDMDGDPPLPDPNFFGYISRKYDMCEFNNATVQITFNWETRAEQVQESLAEVSFDNGNTWQEIFRHDENNNGGGGVEFGQAVVSVGANSGAYTAALTSPANTDCMILRFAALDGSNNWWFAVDDVLVEADPQAAQTGDANGDGIVDFGDIEPFVEGLFDVEAWKANYPGLDPNCRLDINGDGNVDFGDIEPFVDLLFN